MTATTVTPDNSASPANTDGRTRVALLYGGRSSEHSVSVVTAAGVLGAIDTDKYDVLPIGITKTGRWIVKDPREFDLSVSAVPEVTSDSNAEVVLSYESGDHSVRIIEPGKVPVELGAVDVVFPVLHGPYGEDGTLQGLLELADVPYVGLGVLGSAVGMDKHFMKVAFSAAGIHVGPYVVFRKAEWDSNRNELIARVSDLRFPLYVKPARAGSSIGITRIDSIDELEAAVDEAMKHDPKVLVEQGIDGREIECAILSGRDGAMPRASVPGEVIKGDEWYSFESKYLGDGDIRLQIPADLTPEQVAKVQEVAIRAFQAIDGEGLSRSDVFLTPEGDVLMNEINTLPGFTQISMFPQMWAASGIAYPDLIDELIQLALNRPMGLR
jgi:D-alanine-D-alanine ligase